MAGHIKLHSIGDVTNHTSGTFAELDALVGDATLVESTDINSLSSAIDTNTTNISNVTSTVQTNSGNWDGTYSTVLSNSSSWEESADISALSSAIDTNTTNIATNTSNISDVTSTVQTNSGNWEGTYSTVLANSSSWEESADISALSSAIDTNTGNIATNTTNISDVTTTLQTNSGDWEGTYSTVSTNSGAWGGSDLTDISAQVDINTADIAGLTTTLQTNSGEWESTYSTVLANSGAWGGSDLTDISAQVDTNTADIASLSSVIDTNTSNIATNTSNISDVTSTVQTNSGDWEGTYSTVLANSASWEESADIAALSSAIDTNTNNITANDADITALSSAIDTNTTNIATNTTNISDVTTTVQTNSGNWDSTYSTVDTNSADWEGTYSTVLANSASWEESADITALSSAIDTNTTNIATNTSNISDVTTTLQTNSADWEGTYSTVLANSASWEESADISALSSAIDTNTANIASNDTDINSLSSAIDTNTGNITTNTTNISNVTTTVQTNSADWEGTYSTVLSNSSSWEESADISALSSAIDTNTANISSNDTDINSLSSAIDTNTSNIALNTTHRTSDGTDHTFINQDVTSGATPIFNGLSANSDITIAGGSAGNENTISNNGDILYIIGDGAVGGGISLLNGPIAQCQLSMIDTGLEWSLPGGVINGNANEFVINDGGTDWDFRVEGDTDPNLFKTDGGNDAVLIGNDVPTGTEKFLVNGNSILSGTTTLETGTSINEFSTDGTLIDNSDNAVPTEQAVKTYVDALSSSYIDRSSWNGTFRESFDGRVTSDGATITFSLSGKDGGDLTMQFSDGDSILDCTPPAEVTLSGGTATVPQANYVYVPQSTKTLTASTTNWPGTEHIKVSFLFCQDAPSLSATGPLINQNWNDELASFSDNMGHITHIGQWIRRKGATWFSGVAGAGATDYITITTQGAAPDNVDFKSSSGIISQMHLHNYGAKDTSTGDKIYVINHPTEPYQQITDLNTQLVDSENNSLVGKYFNITFAGVANKGGEYSPLFVLLPSGSYTNSSDAINDVNGYNNDSLPREFINDSSTGFLICRVTFRHTSVSGGTWTVENTQDLRGTTGVTASGAGGASVTNFNDANFTIFNNTDSTKIIDVDASAITTGNTRTITMADADVNLADIATNTSNITSNDTDITSLSSAIDTNTTNISNVTTTVQTNSGNWDSTYSTVLANSGAWGGSDLADLSAQVLSNDVDISFLSGEIDNVTTTVQTNSGNWENAISAIVQDTTPELGGELNAGANSIGFTVNALTGTVGTTNIDWTNGNKASFQFGAGNETISFTDPTYACNLLLTVTQDTSGSRTLSWASSGSIKWLGGTEPTLSTTATSGEVDIISFYYDGNVYYGQAGIGFY
jgi:F0F1-type ATP synthase epsilon subunit